MSAKQDNPYAAKIAKMTDRELVDEVSQNVFDATMTSAFGGDSSKEDERCRMLHTLLHSRGKGELYQQGWREGTEGIRP